MVALYKDIHIDDESSAAAENDAKVVSEKLEELSTLEEESKQNLNRRVAEIQASLENQDGVLEKHTKMLVEVAGDVRTVMTAVYDLLMILMNTFWTDSWHSMPMMEVVFEIKDVFRELERIPRNLSQYQDAMLLEDSLGYVLPVPLQTISSWEVSRSSHSSRQLIDLAYRRKTLHRVLCDKFIDRPGYDLVRRGQYVFQDGASPRDLSPNIKLTAVVRPGQTVHMSMIIFSPRATDNSCPRCGVIARAGGETDVEWQVFRIYIHQSRFIKSNYLNSSNAACRMIYRRVIDNSAWLLTGDQETSLVKFGSQIVIEDNSHFGEDLHITERIPLKLVQIFKSDDSADVFKRVRLFTRWQDAIESRKYKPIFKYGQISVWEVCLRDPVWNAWVFIECALTEAFDEELKLSPWNDVTYSLFFLGTSRQNSRPMIPFYANNRKVCQWALSITRRLVGWTLTSRGFL